jgi:hypothetical protein
MIAHCSFEASVTDRSYSDQIKTAFTEDLKVDQFLGLLAIIRPRISFCLVFVCSDNCVVLCIACVDCVVLCIGCVVMCPVLLPPDVNPVAVKYTYVISYHE